MNGVIRNPGIDRRALMLGGAAAAAMLRVPALARARSSTVWTFDDLHQIGGVPAHAEGDPAIVETPFGKAMAFDGVDDVVFVDAHPFAGASCFTFEALVRPDGGALAQRWFHLESSDAGLGMKPGDTRCLFEIRVHGEEWCLDAFIKGPTYSQTLLANTKLHPVRRWYHVAQSYDGTTYRSYVNGALQAEHALTFSPQGAGRASVGARMNRVDYFRGSVRQARFTSAALSPHQFWRPFNFSVSPA